MLETAITAWVFFTIIFLGCEMLRLGYNIIMTEYAASRVLREAVTGAANPTTYAVVSDPAARGAQIEDNVINLAASFGLNLGPAAGDNPHVSVCPLGVDCTGGDNAGPGETSMTLKVRYPLPMLFGLTTYTVNVIVIGQNEPFDAF